MGDYEREAIARNRKLLEDAEWLKEDLLNLAALDLRSIEIVLAGNPNGLEAVYRLVAILDRLKEVE